MKTKLLIDADYLLHRASCSTMITTDCGDCKRIQEVYPEECIKYINSMLSGIRDSLYADEMVLYFSCGRSRCFRRKIDPLYKSNRDNSLRHLGIKTTKEMLEKAYKCVSSDYLEADDLIGIEATTQEENVEKIVVGNDKDFKVIPCKYLNYMKIYEGVSENDIESANYNHLVQTLTGDSSDGYRGCNGVGKVKAERIASNGWSAVIDAYIAAGQTEEDALRNARLAWILRKENIDEKGKIKLWLA